MKVQLFILTFILIISGCETTIKNPGDKYAMYLSSPPVMKNISKDMTVPGFWISKLDNPSVVIMTQEEIGIWNDQTFNSFEFMNDIAKFENTISGSRVVELMIEEIDGISKNDSLLFIDGSKPSKNFYKDLRANMDMESITGDIEVRFGFTTGFTDIRSVPTMTLLNYDVGEWDFDVLQYSAADIATPVAVLHESKDGKWLFVSEPQYSGWVMSENIALCSKDELDSYLSKEDFVIVTEAKAEIYLDGKYHDYARLGTKLPIINMSNEFTEVMIPVKGDNGELNFEASDISSEKVHKGYLDYTRENIIKSAFKILNSPYGWGGMFGEQDCSRLLCQVFGTVGLKLPRNSSKQVLAGTVTDISEYIPEEKETMVIKEALAGASFIGFPGHIMLYLGEHEGEPYALHSMWAYKEKIGDEDRIRLVNRTVVSDMSLGEGSGKGSFRERLTYYGMFSSIK